MALVTDVPATQEGQQQSAEQNPGSSSDGTKHAAAAATPGSSVSSLTVATGVGAAQDTHAHKHSMEHEEDVEPAARRSRTVDQLTSVFGFSLNVAEKAVDAVGTDATTCYNYILDKNMGTDSGGPISPIGTCPHLGQHVGASLNTNIRECLGGAARPQEAPCSHVFGSAEDKSNKTKKGGLKEDVHEDGSCPSNENWMCLECGVVRCSRYQNGHSLEHWEQTKQNDATGEGHCLAVSFSDLSVWCYACSAYVKHPIFLNPMLQELEKLKFSVEPTKTQPSEPQHDRKAPPPPSHFHALSPNHVSPTRKKLRKSLDDFPDEPGLTGGGSTDPPSAAAAPATATSSVSSTATGPKEASTPNDADKVEQQLMEKSPSDDHMQTETEEPDDNNTEDDNEEDNEDDEENEEDAERSPARGVPLNFDDEDAEEEENEYEYAGAGDESENSDSNLIQMLAQAAAAQGISLNWLIQQAQDEEDTSPVEYPFESLPNDLAGVAEFIQSDKCKRIIILAGAGMSVASGIPDFRSSDGLYNTLNASSLTGTSQQQDAIRKDPSFALDQLLFMDNPLPLLETKRDFILGTYEQRWKATLAHRFVELLHTKTKKLARLYTQNIDGLEDQCSQLPEELVIPVHGTMDRAECARCKTRASFTDFCHKVRDQIKDINGKDTAAPSVSTPIACTNCGYPAVKPAIVLFRSSLPADFFENVGPDCRGVDLLIVMGTSLKVAPANSLVWRVPRSAMRLLVNREIVGEHLGMDFDENNDQGGRDFFAAGNCDNVLLDLMEHLGWLPDLEPLLAEEKLPQSSASLLQERLAQLHGANDGGSPSRADNSAAKQPIEG